MYMFYSYYIFETENDTQPLKKQFKFDFMKYEMRYDYDLILHDCEI